MVAKKQIMAKKIAQDRKLTLPEAVEEIKRLQAIRQDLQDRNNVLRRKRVAMVQNTQAKLAAQRLMKVVEEWHSKRASRAETRLESAYAEFERERAQHQREITELRQQMAQMVPLNAAAGETHGREDGAEATAKTSESRLRLVMTTPNASAEELRSAIQSVEAMVQEARRELDRKEFRQRRSAFEQLMTAIEEAEDDLLVEAIEAAKAAEVDEEDVVKAENKLLELRMLSEEEQAARRARRQENEVKKFAFLLVKQGDVLALSALLDGLDGDMNWEEWKDHQGRSLAEFAKFLGALAVEEAVVNRSAREEDKSFSAEKANMKNAADVDEEAAEEVTSTEVETQPEEAGGCPAETEGQVDEEQATKLSPEEEETFKKRAFAAVVQGKNEELEELMKLVKPAIWERWQNKGGKNLLTLCEERGKDQATSILLKAMGIVKEMQHEALEERQDVWIYTNGEVQPARATVLEDTPANAKEVLIEYWDGDEPAHYIERCRIRTSY